MKKAVTFRFLISLCASFGLLLILNPSPDDGNVGKNPTPNRRAAREESQEFSSLGKATRQQERATDQQYYTNRDTNRQILPAPAYTGDSDSVSHSKTEDHRRIKLHTSERTSRFIAIDKASEAGAQPRLALTNTGLNNPSKDSSLILPQIVDGGGIPTQILLMNPSPTDTASGNISLFDDNGNSFAADFGPTVGVQSRLSYSIPANGMVKFSTTGVGQARAGYAVVTAQSGLLPVAGAVFSINGSAGRASEAGVLSSPQTTSARFYAEVSSAPPSRNTGIAIVNRNSSTAAVKLSLVENITGNVRTTTLNVGMNAHVAKFINELFTDLPADFAGTLTLTSNVPVAPLTLRLTTNQRGDPILSTLPVADLNNPPVGSQYLAQIVSGGGFTTELILINTSSDPIAVQIDFFDDKGVKVTSPFP